MQLRMWWVAEIRKIREHVKTEWGLKEWTVDIDFNDYNNRNFKDNQPCTLEFQ